MGKMPELVQLRNKLKDTGLAIVGINFDGEKERALGAIERHGLDWPQVHASSAVRGKESYWEDVAGIRGLPRFFLIDREGILREDFYPRDLEEKVLPWLRKMGD